MDYQNNELSSDTVFVFTQNNKRKMTIKQYNDEFLHYFFIGEQKIKILRQNKRERICETTLTPEIKIKFCQDLILNKIKQIIRVYKAREKYIG